MRIRAEAVRSCQYPKLAGKDTITIAKDHDLTYDQKSMIQIPTPNRRIRFMVMGYGLVLFLWFTSEDNQVLPVTLLGWGMAALVVFMTLVNKLGGRQIPARYTIPVGLALGALVGLGSGVATAAFMFFKNALHAHLFFDFPAPMMLAILERAPYWGLAGGLAGLGTALAWAALKLSAKHID